MKRFNELIINERRKQGFNSQRSFFYSRGGENYFGCSYRFYSLIEQGKTFPDAELLGKILLKLNVSDPKDFIKAYLVSKATPEIANYFHVTLGSETIQEKKEAADESKNKQQFILNEEQLRLLSSSRDVNHIFNIFLFNKGL